MSRGVMPGTTVSGKRVATPAEERAMLQRLGFVRGKRGWTPGKKRRRRARRSGYDDT